jgi:hypothetical protein
MRQMRHLSLSSVAGQGLPVLLAALNNMQQLQHLVLHGDSSLEPLHGNAMHQYAALTASSHLTCLDLFHDEHVIADGVAQYMFAAGKQLPQLKLLQFDVEDWDCSDYAQPIGAGDLARIAAACPALESFRALPCISLTEDISDLTLLTSVTELKVGGFDLCAAELSGALVKMTQLVDLQVSGVDYFDAAELAALTQLTGLWHLFVEAKDDQTLLEQDYLSIHRRVSASVFVGANIY